MRHSLIKRLAALEEIIESRRPWTPESCRQTLDDAARRFAGCRFLDLGNLEAQTVFNEAMPDITAEQIEDLMRQVERRYGKTREEMLALADEHASAGNLAG